MTPPVQPEQFGPAIRAGRDSDAPVAELDRDEFPHRIEIPTRWNDNDVYGHVNNVEYYAFFDSVINRWLITEGGLDIHQGDVIGLCAESRCRFLAPIAFPETLEAGVRVASLGRTSVRYEIGLFHAGTGELLAAGWFVHVFVDRASRRPTTIPAGIRASLEGLVAGGER
jgi:acyl-CoA thioester hydrolase